MTASTLDSIAGADPPSPAPSVDWQQRHFETLAERNRFETALAQINRMRRP